MHMEEAYMKIHACTNEIQRNEEEIIQVQDHGGPHPLT